jgi:hypothetical protein
METLPYPPPDVSSVSRPVSISLQEFQNFFTRSMSAVFILMPFPEFTLTVFLRHHDRKFHLIVSFAAPGRDPLISHNIILQT